ncbi:unnamed protein product [Rodentolepis nana]|uniref:CUE domain-containing protein n=1 Tax=Rodentolepis nana TaxID=102285 RepID=A0A0R3TZ15_RODNA|nr:unnamed protein product [Rodentolepis nana]
MSVCFAYYLRKKFIAIRPSRFFTTTRRRKHFFTALADNLFLNLSWFRNVRQLRLIFYQGILCVLFIQREVIPGGGILGRTLTDWTRKRGKKHVSSGHRDITESVSEARKRASQAAAAAAGGGAGGPGGGANGPSQPGVVGMPVIQVTAAHPAVIAVANLGDDRKISTTVQGAPEEKGGGGLMGLIRRGSSYLKRREAEEEQKKQEEERKEDLELARTMFAAARRESYYGHRNE